MLLRGIVVSIVLAGTGFPQAFEVASIKVTEGRERDSLLNGVKATPGGVTVRSLSLKGCIAWAYHVFEYQVSGPEWMANDLYEIAAKAPGATSEANLRKMMQRLLADRFHVGVHHVTKEMQAYVLSVGKDGPKFHDSKSEGDADVTPDMKTMSIGAHRIAVSQLVDILSRVFQMPVIDKTGMPGVYDVTINVAKYLPHTNEAMDPLALIQMGLQEELGLKLDAKKVPVELIVVDRAEKLPVEN